MAVEGRGRPRDASRDVVILETVLQMLLEVGYDRLSIDGVAARSGVGKTTIYRRYPDKAALVTAAVDRRMGPPAAPVAARPRALRDALRAVAGDLGDEMSAHGAALLNAMFAAMRHDVSLADSMRRTLERDSQELVERLCSEPLADHPSLSPSSAALVGEVATAMILRRLTVVGQPCDAPFLDHLVDDVLRPLVERA